MHRSALSVLVVFAAAAACSTHDDSEATQLLSKDPALGARLEVARDDRQLSLPDACGTVSIAAQPSAAGKSQAEELTRQANKSEILGNVQEARALLRRASELDATNSSVVYHLGRTSEELGDSTAATSAYCRYMALSPSTAESADARERVSRLAQSVTSVAAGNVSDSTGAAGNAGTASTVRRTRSATLRSVTHTQPAHRSSVRASAAVARSGVATSSARRAHSVASAVGSGVDSPKSGGAATNVSMGDVAPEHPAAGGARSSDDVAAGRPLPSDDQPSSASRSASGGPGRAQSAGIGAAAGAILGVVTGRSMKSAVIGAAAGGILGTMVGHGRSPIGTGTFH